MKVDAVEVRTGDVVKDSAVPEGYRHVVLHGIMLADDAVALCDAASEPVAFEIEVAGASDLDDKRYDKISEERKLLASRGRL